MDVQEKQFGNNSSRQDHKVCMMGNKGQRRESYPVLWTTGNKTQERKELLSNRAPCCLHTGQHAPIIWLTDKAAGGLTKPFCLTVDWIVLTDCLWVRGVEIIFTLWSHLAPKGMYLHFRKKGMCNHWKHGSINSIITRKKVTKLKKSE